MKKLLGWILTLILVTGAMPAVEPTLVPTAYASGWGVNNPEFSPEAAGARLSGLVSRESFDILFPFRIGGTNWKTALTNWPELRGAYAGRYMQMDDYYSYDNFIEAVKEVADIKLKLEYRINPDGTTVGYAPRTSMLKKSTGEEFLLSEHPDFWVTHNLSKKIYTEIVDCGAVLGEGSQNDRLRELSAMFGHKTQETGGGIGWLGIDEHGAVTATYGLSPAEQRANMLNQALWWNEEVTYIGSNSSGYTAADSIEYPPTAGQSYHGRGPVQLSWNYNYGRVSLMVYQDKQILLDNPNLILECGKLGFMTMLLFWMTPDSGKPSCHDVMIAGKWQPNEHDISAGRTSAGFGMTTMIINGGLEGNLAYGQDSRITNRIDGYIKAAAVFGADLSNDGQMDTLGMSGRADSWQYTTTDPSKVKDPPIMNWIPSIDFPANFKVYHNGRIWESRYWASAGAVPGVDGAWTDLGPIPNDCGYCDQTPCVCPFGDVDGNGYINSGDVTMLRRYIAHMAAGGTTQQFESAAPGFNVRAADVNGDGTVNAADVTLLRRYLAATNPATVPLGRR
jgi:hypothetical protein